jgi:copper oxidase (laccase) domain-containing protein
MLHGGWRGLAGGVVAAGVRALRELDTGGPVEAAIGPGAGACCYEVGDEVRRAFAAEPEALAEAAGGTRLDLAAVARARLAAEGVEAVHDVGLCTICSDPALFFSHRRDGGATGRQAGVARRR